MEQLPGIYDALAAAGANYGLQDFGLYAMDSMRLDKCYRGWKSDIESDPVSALASWITAVSFPVPGP
jgi:dimethylglycine dehydrogenase